MYAASPADSIRRAMSGMKGKELLEAHSNLCRLASAGSNAGYELGCIRAYLAEARRQREAEAEGIDRIVRAAGAEWREPGCSMCIAMNGDLVGPGQLAVSTSNRNFEGRQGRDARTVLASPITAAACAVAGHVVDPRLLVRDAIREHAA